MPTRPQPAIDWDLHLAFFDDFDSIATIDANKTYGQGFKWYPTNWPKFNGNPATFGTNTYSFNNSVLTLSNTGLNPGNTWNSNISTVGYLSDTGTRTIGRTFDASRGLYVRSRMRFDLPATNGGLPGWYIMDLTTILSLIDQTAHTGGEIDVFEAQSNRINQTDHVWTNWDTASSGQRPAGGIYATGIVSCPSQLDTTVSNDYGVLIVPNSLNAGSGFITWDINSLPIGGNGPASPDTMIPFQEEKYVIQLVADPTRPLDVASLEVYSGVGPFVTQLTWS